MLYNLHQQTQQNECDEKNHMIMAAVNFLKQDIRNISQTNDAYVSVGDLSTDTAMWFLLPPLLLLFKTLFCGKDSRSKIASIDQTIMQATLTRLLMAPLLIGLGVQMHHVFHSKCLVDSFHQHGFSCSNSEVDKYQIRPPAILYNTPMTTLTTMWEA